MSSNTKLEKFKTQYKFICMSASQTRQTITVFHCWGDCNWEVSPGGNEGWPFIVQHIRSLWRCGEQSPKSTLWSELRLNNPRLQAASSFNQPLQVPDFIQEWRQSHHTALWHSDPFSHQTSTKQEPANKLPVSLPFPQLGKASC